MARCKYCDFILPTEPSRKALVRAGYCSHGCRLAVEQPLSRGGKNIVSLDVKENDQHDVLRWDGEAFTATDAGEGPTPASAEPLDLTEVPDAARERLRCFLASWLRAPRTTQVIVVQKLLGARDVAIARQLKCCPQLVHRAANEARSGSKILRESIHQRRNRRHQKEAIA